MNGEMLYWIWLSLAVTPGSETYAILRNTFCSPKEIFDADAETIAHALGDKKTDFRRLCDKRLTKSRSIWDFCCAKNAYILTYDDPRYPERLRRIVNPPVLLYYAGKLPDLNKEFYVACVGSRYHSEYSKRMTFEVAYELAIAGASVVSGLAYGLDSVALAAAHAAGGSTLSVLGCGIDRIYPPEHTSLARSLCRNGAILSEYPPGTSPHGTNFPIRNRIISALSHAVVVTGGTGSSGSLITAKYAKQQGRELYAIPGNLDDPHSHGPLMLLRDGAKAVTCCEDVLSHFEDQFPTIIKIHCLLADHPYDMENILHQAGVTSLAKPRQQKERGHTASYTPLSSDIHGAASGNPTEASEASVASVASVEEVPRAPQSAPVSVKPAKAKAAPKGLPKLSELETTVYEKIPAYGGCEIESLVDADCPMGKVNAALIMLEVKQLIRFVGNNKVERMD